MREVERIADQLKRAHEGGAWHGPAVDELLKGLSAAQAAARPVEGAHSIWEMVAHIEAWERAILRRLGGDAAQIYQTEEDWTVALGSVRRGLGRGAPEDVGDLRRPARGRARTGRRRELDEPILPNMSTRYVSLHGAIQHTLYHAGQIALVRKALGLKPLTIDSDTAGTI